MTSLSKFFQGNHNKCFDPLNVSLRTKCGEVVNKKKTIINNNNNNNEIFNNNNNNNNNHYHHHLYIVQSHGHIFT